MTDPLADILGDYRAFFAGQKDRLRARGIDISPYPLSHLAYRVHEYDRYLQVRDQLERHAAANVENIWNGRPISKILLREPLHVEPQVTVDLIELLPPPHQRVYKMGLEHVGVVVGDGVDEFARTHRAVLTGQQFQSEDFEPYYILFEDFTHVKFYRYSLRAGSERQGHGLFDGFVHVDDWVPPVLRTATRGDDPRRAP
jgi:predicted metalloenzyme YecM